MAFSEQSTFLTLLAQHCLQQYGDELYRCCFVFPSQRAGTFFRHQLAQQLSSPAFAPQIITVEQLTEVLSGLKLATRTHLICLLYRQIISLREELSVPVDEKTNASMLLDHAEKLLIDFNDIDNYCVPADELFRNLKALDNLTTLEYLTDEQRELIEQFFGRVFAQNQEKTERIEELYTAMTTEMQLLYTRLRTQLKLCNMAYSGMMAREAAEAPLDVFEKNLLTLLNPHIKHIVVAGLYHLTTAEKSIFLRLKSTSTLCSVSFFWEGLRLQHYTTPEQWNPIVGSTLEESQKLLGGTWVMPPDTTTPPKVQYIQVPSSVGLAKMVAPLVQELLSQDAKAIEQLQCAVLMPDVHALLPLVESLNGLEYPVNISMGYPLKLSPVAIWAHRFLDLQRQVRYEKKTKMLPVAALKSFLYHPLSQLILHGVEQKTLKELLEKSFYYLPYSRIESLAIEPVTHLLEPLSCYGDLAHRLIELLDFLLRYLVQEETPQQTDTLEDDEPDACSSLKSLEIEFITHFRELVVQLLNLNETLQEVELPDESAANDVLIFSRLLLKLLEGENLSFEGEPLQGLQVLGLLESRLINFKYLLVLHANEGDFPHRRPANRGYIPLQIRVGFGMPSYRSEEFTEAYYFYRLIAQARTIYFLSDSRTEKEPSRFMAQLQYLMHLSPLVRSVALPVATHEIAPITVAKDQETMERLRCYTVEGGSTKTLSASSLATYAQCPLKFYYRYIRGAYDMPEEEDLLSPALFGSVTHKVMERIYKPFEEGKWVSLQELEQWLDRKISLPKITRLTRQAYGAIVLGKKETLPHDIQGIHEIYTSMIVTYVYTILKHDAAMLGQCNQLQYIASELPFRLELTLPQGGCTVCFSGFIDRVDRCGEVLRLIDYKTGREQQHLPDWERLFRSDTDKKSPYKAFAQLMLYAEAVLHGTLSTPIPSLVHDFDKIRPALYMLREMSKETPERYDPYLTYAAVGERKKLPLESYEEVREAFLTELYPLLEELFDAEKPFTQTLQPQHCTYCHFKYICHLK